MKHRKPVSLTTPIEFELVDRTTCPPNGWRYIQPESGVRFEHYSRDAFFRNIQAHRLANGYAIEPGWEAAIEDQLCREHAAEWGPGICQRAVHLGERRPVSMAAMQGFFNTMGAWVSGGAGFVPQEVADARAAICVTCPNNAANPGSCGGCADRILRGITRLIGRRRTRYDASLGSCAICSCSLAVAVHFPLEAQQAGLSEELREAFRAVPFCWKRDGL
jgi:hypothetical protein